MPAKSINEVFAENLQQEMAARELTQAGLAKLCKVAQTSIGNYLKPGKRAAGATGKEPSAKLTEMAMIAAVFSMEPWEMLVDRRGLPKAYQNSTETEMLTLFRELPDQAQSTLIDNLRLLHRATRQARIDEAEIHHH